MHKGFLITAIVLGGLSVALGAFGAHGLESLTGDEKILHAFQTAVQYQMYHALALLIVAAVYDKLYAAWVKWAARLFVAGVIGFSGSLYLLTFLKIQGSSAVKVIGPVTPLGGLLLITGWVCLLIAALKRTMK